MAVNSATPVTTPSAHPCAVALIDRLTHHAEIISIDGESYRKREAEQAQKLIDIQRAAREVGTDLDVLSHGQVGDEVVHLENVAQMAAAVQGQGLFVHVGHAFAVDEDVAGIGAVDAAQDVEQRGLARAGRPQQHAEFAFFNGKVDALQHFNTVFTTAKGLFDLIQFKKHRDAPLLVSVC